jgi:transcriptional regulator with XRE-family HTH domain
MPDGSTPTVRRRELGAALRRYRQEAGLTVKAVTESLLLPVGKISRIESGQRNATLRDVRDLCDLYGVKDRKVRAYLMDLAREGRQPGWWREFDLERGYRRFVGLEAAASAISEYQTSTVPGLLQIRQYAYEMVKVWRHDASLAQIDQEVKVRLTRQDVLRGEKVPRFHAILDEAVLRRQVGGPDVMRTQLQHIVRMSELRLAVVQVIPFAAGSHTGMDSIFVLLDFPQPQIPSVVYLDGLIGQIFVEQQAEIERYRRAFADLAAIALGPSDSIDLVKAVSNED